MGKNKMTANDQNVNNVRLVKLSQPEKLGLPFSRRTLNRRIRDDADFPPTFTINGRLYANANDIEEYKITLMRRGAEVKA